MKKNNISPKSAGEATISYSNFKIVECGRGTPPPTPTSSRALRPQFRRYALLLPLFHQQSPLHFFPLANALIFLGHTIPKLCVLVNAIVINLCKITEPRKKQLNFEILHNSKEF